MTGRITVGAKGEWTEPVDADEEEEYEVGALQKAQSFSRICLAEGLRLLVLTLHACLLPVIFLLASAKKILF